MSGVREQPQDREAAVSIHPELASRKPDGFAREARAEEFDRLVISSDCEVCDSVSVPIRRPLAGTLFGRGQIEKIRREISTCKAAVVFVDHPLSPVQQRNLERAWNAKVVDRTGLTLEIFAFRARTREGTLQVELASLNYQISRLVRSWTHLERQRGGFGFLGGPGERQIELDRRLIRNRIRQLDKELAKLRRMRGTQRGARRRKEIPTVALVGYTNAGKSTLFNRLTQSGVYVADQLFATLDPTLRMVELDGGRRLILSDTVGFVQDLPHELVDAFRATLEEVAEADLILHVRDASDPQVIEQGEVVVGTLKQIGVKGDEAPPVIEVWNKLDLVPQIKSTVRDEITGSRVALSALTGAGVDTLLGLLRDWLETRMLELSLTVAAADGRTLAYCHEHGRIIRRKTHADTVELTLMMTPRDAGRIKKYNGLHRLVR